MCGAATFDAMFDTSGKSLMARDETLNRKKGIGLQACPSLSDQECATIAHKKRVV